MKISFWPAPSPAISLEVAIALVGFFLGQLLPVSGCYGDHDLTLSETSPGCCHRLDLKLRAFRPLMLEFYPTLENVLEWSDKAQYFCIRDTSYQK